MGVGDVSKRILVGRKLRSTQSEGTLLPKKIALPVFASDALSSVAYAPDEVFIMLGIAGFAAYEWSWKVGIAVAVVMLTVVASYRQTVREYPSGGGEFTPPVKMKVYQNSPKGFLPTMDNDTGTMSSMFVAASLVALFAVSLPAVVDYVTSRGLYA